MITYQEIKYRFNNLNNAFSLIEVTDDNNITISLDDAFNSLIMKMRECNKRGNKLCIVGNGGSAAIASHMAIDYTKNGGIRAIAFNDASLLTCLSNDFSYAKIFDAALDCYGDTGDILVAISSSGNSENILGAATKSNQIGMEIITLSGFEEDNPLRQMGDLNFYVPTKKGEYGIAEIMHLAILHTILDMICEDK